MQWMASGEWRCHVQRRDTTLDGATGGVGTKVGHETLLGERGPEGRSSRFSLLRVHHRHIMAVVIPVSLLFFYLLEAETSV